jgi:hypothetical protein
MRARKRAPESLFPVPAESFGWWVAQARGLVADGGRFFYGLVYWNLRKSLFRLSRQHIRNPCQNLSDGQVAGSIRCDACVHWSRPGRFHRVCPLLVRRDNEWLCGAPANEIRSFWGRALGWQLGAALAGYLILSLTIFGALKATRTFEVSWWQVAWPGHWDQIPKSRAQAFFDRAIRAFARGRSPEAIVALGTARGLDAQGYDTRLLQAQLAMFQANHAYADEEFGKLLQEFPDRLGRTALVYHDTALALFRADALAEHCLAMTRLEPARTALWLRSLLHAFRLGANVNQLFTRHPEGLERLPPHARLLVDAERAIQAGDKRRAQEILARPFDGPLNPVYLEEQLIRLARLGAVDAARTLQRRIGPLTGDFEYVRTEVHLDFFTPDPWDERLDFRRLLALPLRGPEVERVIALLVAHPDAGSFRLLDALLRQRPELAAQVSGAAMWVAALATGATELGGFWKTAGRQQFGDSYPSISTLNFETREIERIDGVPSLVNALTLPRDVIFALQGRMTPKTAR